MNEIIRGKGPLRRVNIHVVKIQDNEPTVFEERLVFPFGELTAETNDR